VIVGGNSVPGLRDILRASARLAILRFLADDSDYRLNTSVLEDALVAIGLDLTRGQIETECAWLEERDCVASERVGTVTVIRLTERGGDVAAGRVRVEGVKRPGPGA
jgi:hypothetical protein